MKIRASSDFTEGRPAWLVLSLIGGLELKRWSAPVVVAVLLWFFGKGVVLTGDVASYTTIMTGVAALLCLALVPALGAVLSLTEQLRGREKERRTLSRSFGDIKEDTLCDLMLGGRLGAYRFLKHVKGVNECLGSILDVGVVVFLSVLLVGVQGWIGEPVGLVVLWFCFVLVWVGMRGFWACFQLWSGLGALKTEGALYVRLADSIEKERVFDIRAVQLLEDSVHWLEVQKERGWVPFNELDGVNDAVEQWESLWLTCVKKVVELEGDQLQRFNAKQYLGGIFVTATLEGWMLQEPLEGDAEVIEEYAPLQVLNWRLKGWRHEKRETLLIPTRDSPQSLLEVELTQSLGDEFHLWCGAHLRRGPRRETLKAVLMEMSRMREALVNETWECEYGRKVVTLRLERELRVWGYFLSGEN